MRCEVRDNAQCESRNAVFSRGSDRAAETAGGLHSMSIFWVFSFAVLVGLVAGVIALAVYRRVISRDEMDIMHVRDAEVALIAGQQAYADRLDAIDTWGKRL